MLAESKLPLIEHRAELFCKCFVTKSIFNKKSLTHENIRNFNHKLKSKKYTIKKNPVLSRCIDELLNSESKIQYCSYDIHSYYYKTVHTSIPINTELGKTLKKV